MTIPGFYRWEVAGKPVSIRISLDVVDRLQQDVMRGFGAVPKRGAEIGGVLLGAANGGGSISVEEYELIPIEYKRGPSYLLSDEDVGAFEAALNDLRQKSRKDLHPIGYFRSHTRDGVGLGDEDRELLSRYFPEPETIVLLIRPFGTKPSIAGFYFKEDGQFPSGAPLLEFPFRRKDLLPEEEPRISELEPEPEQPAQQARRWPIQNPAPQPALEIEEVPAPVEAAEYIPVDVEIKSKARRGWFWMPLSFIFLLLGLLLGFQAALTVRQSGRTDPYNVTLTVTKSGSDLQVTWDRQALAIRTALKGVLTIEDGNYSKPTNLGASELRSGSVVIYKPLTDHVRFRLDLSLKDRDSFSEAVEWKQ
ncbi:MAG TPA: hypothetical protein VEU96_04235 [Bryobacteraceae bacterium]|nr:hypothetical protein [Bryobacteraceae bacterium]